VCKVAHTFSFSLNSSGFIKKYFFVAFILILFQIWFHIKLQLYYSYNFLIHSHHNNKNIFLKIFFYNFVSSINKYWIKKLPKRNCINRIKSFFIIKMISFLFLFWIIPGLLNIYSNCLLVLLIKYMLKKNSKKKYYTNKLFYFNKI
jgi:hypothetical protein